MLKAPEKPPSPEPDRSVGEMIEQVFDDALTYVRAEIELIKVRALDFISDYVRAAILFAIAAVFCMAGLVTLFVGVAMALARWIGPLGGAIVSTLIAAGIAGFLVWLALRELEKAK
jgi:uncharacterized membrane protein YqjE